MKDTLESFPPEMLTTDVLDSLCRSNLGISLQALIKLGPLLREIEKLLNSVVKPTRFAGLVEATTKKDPMDCSYVKKCVIDLLRSPEEFARLRFLLGSVGDRFDV